MESKPSEPQPTTSKPPTNEPAGWDVTFYQSDGKRATVVRCRKAPPMGLAVGLDAQDPSRVVSVSRVVCSACGRGAHGFAVPHDPTVCDYLRNAAYRPMRMRGIPVVLPRDKRTRAYRTVRRELGILVE